MPKYYLLVGDEETWQVSLGHRLWGFSERVKGNWNTLEVGDYLAFYVTSPVKKVIGFGKVVRKFIEETTIWSDEQLFRKPIWKYRIEFEILCLMNNWQNGISVPQTIMLNTGRKKVERVIFTSLVVEADHRWKTKVKSMIFR